MAIEQFIENEVKSNDVVLFMKGTPQFPMCGFSGQVVQILDYLGVPYQGPQRSRERRSARRRQDFSEWPTIPQLYVKGEFVGGCDIIREMFQAGELHTLFKEERRSGEGSDLRFELGRGTAWSANPLVAVPRPGHFVF